MLIRFRTDRSASFDGFRMVITATLGPAKGCGGWLNGTTEWQKFGAPIDPQTGRHYSNMRCEWTIQVTYKYFGIFELANCVFHRRLKAR
jgi:hypothetical protein